MYKINKLRVYIVRTQKRQKNFPTDKSPDHMAFPDSTKYIQNNNSSNSNAKSSSDFVIYWTRLPLPRCQKLDKNIMKKKTKCQYH